MFDISFSEILVMAVVALVVLGPERLPQVARTLGHLFGRVQRYATDIRNDIQREMELEELGKLKTSVQETARSIENAARGEISRHQPSPDLPERNSPLPVTKTTSSDTTMDAQPPENPIDSPVAPARTNDDATVDQLVKQEQAFGPDIRR